MSSLNIDTWSTTPGSNNATPPNGAPEGMAFSTVNDTMRQIMAVVTSQVRSLPTAGGTANALTVTNAPALTTLVTGQLQVLNPASANTSAATFAPDGLTAKNIFAWGRALVGGEIQPSVPALLKYDGTQWNLLNPCGSANEVTVFTANGNFTPKITANYLVIAIGGGGGGGAGGASGASNGGQGGSGGSGGIVGFSSQALTGGSSYAVVIGAAGTAGTGGAGLGGDGGDGGATTFNAVTISAGGKGGRGGRQSAFASGSGGAGTNGGGNGGGQGGTAGAVGSAAAANSGGGGGGGGGNGGGAGNGFGGGAGGTGVLIVMRA